MGSHDCRVSGLINVKPAVTEADVRKAMHGFLKAHGLKYDELIGEGSIELHDGQLNLSLEIHGFGGYQDDDLDALVAELCTIVEGRDYIEFLDFDTGDQDAQCTPYFIGATEADRTLAQVDYGILLMEPYVAPVVGKDAFLSVSVRLRADARLSLGLDVPPSDQDADTGPEAAKLFMEELLASVESLTELADMHGARTLADLVYLQQAILKGGFIDHYPGESKVLEVVKELPSHQRWVGFIELAKD